MACDVSPVAMFRLSTSYSSKTVWCGKQWRGTDLQYGMESALALSVLHKDVWQ